MKTAEVAIEHVLTGLLALCAFLLPLLSGLSFNEKLLESQALIAVLGLAYLFGVVFDRLADTILSPMEQQIRLRVADECLEKGEPLLHGDPFPQDLLEFSLRGEQGGRVDWMDSLRSRIRTSRGLTVFGLPAVMGITIFLTAKPAAQVRWEWHPHRAVAINLLLIMASIVLFRRWKTDKSANKTPGPTLETSKGDGRTEIVIERTHKDIASPVRPDADSESTQKARDPDAQTSKTRSPLRRLKDLLKPLRTDELSADSEERKDQLRQGRWRMWIGFVFLFMMWLTSAATIGSLVTWPKQIGASVVVVLAVAIATALPLIVWYRITETHMKFIRRKLRELLEKDTPTAWKIVID